ncbi:MAG: tetratricopeptide repeat protein [Candidatus Krumholzibacteriia bacterium]
MIRIQSRHVLAGLIAVPLILGSCGPQQEGPSDVLRREFAAACPKPTWWDEVSIKGVTIVTYDDLIAYWQNKERSKSQFFKAAYQTILDHPENTDLLVAAIGLMPYGDTTYPHTIALLEFAVDHFFDYDRPTMSYSGKSADTIAGIVEKLAKAYNGRGRYDDTLALVERFLREREAQTNDHLLELLSLPYAAAHHANGQQEQAVVVLEDAISRYEGGWEKRLQDELQRYRN